MNPTPNYPLTLLYDGACPICSLEMDNLRTRDSLRRLMFVDIAQPDFDPTPYGATIADMQALIHAVRPDGSLVIGVPALRLAYQAVGLGALAAPTGWPLLAPVFDWAYRVFARNRYGVSGALMPLIAHVAHNRAAKRAVKRAAACADGVCDLTKADLMPKEAPAQVKPAQAAIKKEASQTIYPERSVV